MVIYAAAVSVVRLRCARGAGLLSRRRRSRRQATPHVRYATSCRRALEVRQIPIRDFAPITLLSQSPNLWIVHPSLPAKNMHELIALAKTRPGEINYSSSGTGSSQHLAGELLKSLAPIDVVHISYKGSPPALLDVLGGRV